MINEQSLPLSWSYVPIEDVAKINPRTFSILPTAKNLPVHFVSMSAVKEEYGGINVSTQRILHEVQKGYTSFLEDDVLFAKITPCMENGKLALVPHLENHIAFGSTEFHVLRATLSVSPKWLSYFLSQAEFRRMARHNMTGSAGQMRVSTNWLALTKIPVAPYKEQTRIITKLEELLTDLDAGVNELKTAQKKLTQYRQSLLKAAVEGALTAEWRANNTPSESGSQLLERILKERRACWEKKQLDKFNEQGKILPKDWQSKYSEPVKPDTKGLMELPEGWVWASLSQIGWLDRGRSKHRPRNAPHLYGGLYPFVQTGDIRHADTFITKVDASYSEAGLAQSKLWPIGTICITIAANIGKTAILAVEACFPDSVVGFLPVSEEVSNLFVEYFLRTAQQKLEDEAPATAQKNINLEILEKVCIPLPPIKEQQYIVEIVSGTLSAASSQESSILTSLKQSAAQRKNILKAAFSGQLIPQDPNDEPASVLLERIKSERVTQKIPSKFLKGHKTTEAS